MKATRFVGFLLLFTCFLAGAQPVPARVDTGRHSLWRVEGKSNVVYLAGSIHLLKPENYPLAPVIDAAFTNSRIAVFEADVGKLTDLETQMKLLTKGQLPEGETLEEQLSPATYKALTNQIEASGLPLIIFNSLKPGMVAVTLEAMAYLKLGFDVNDSMDKRYFERARRDGKEIIPLETVDFQLDLITEFPKADAEALVRSTLKEIVDIEKSYREVVVVWQTGDAAKLDNLLHRSMGEATGPYKRMVTDRNRNWLPKIEELARGNKNTIVMVGAGHLVGAEGVVELLKKDGFKVTQL